MTISHKVLVLGAGYAGLPAAKRLARQVFPDEVEVTLVSATGEFLERPRLHQLATGQEPARLDLEQCLAGSGVALRVGTVTHLDLEDRSAAPQEGGPLVYDTLIYALGSRIDATAVPGVADNTVLLNDVGAAHELAATLAGAERARVVVCGGGLTGIEVAAEVAESFPVVDVELVSASAPGSWLSERARSYLHRVFADLGVTVLAGGRVAAVEGGGLRVKGGAVVPFDVCVWAGGFTVPYLAASAGLEVTPEGRAVVDGTLRSRSHRDVFVIGDAAAVTGWWGDRLAMGCRSGGFTGPKVADVVAAELTGRHPARPLRFRYFHECISLGRRRGLVQFLHRDERPANLILTGRKAIHYKDATLNGGKFLFRLPGPYLMPRRRRLAAPTATRDARR